MASWVKVVGYWNYWMDPEHGIFLSLIIAQNSIRYITLTTVFDYNNYFTYKLQAS